MQLHKYFLLLIFVCVSITAIAQSNDEAPKWLTYHFSKKVSLQTAMIEVNNKPATYADLLKIPDSSILKVEVYSKKAAQQIVDKDDAKNGLVLVTLHKKHFPYYSGKKDSAIFIIDDNGDTIHCKNAVPATLDGDTTNIAWGHFLERNLNAQTPADNSAPAGLYNVDFTFLVNKDGSVSEVNVLEDPGYGTAAEVKRLMAKSPLWDPAKCNDTIIGYRQKERITFAVSEE